MFDSLQVYIDNQRLKHGMALRRNTTSFSSAKQNGKVFPLADLDNNTILARDSPGKWGPSINELNLGISRLAV